MSRRIKVSPQPSQLLHLLIRGGQALQWHALQQRSTVRYEYAGDAGSESETLAAALRSCLLATHHPARRADGALGQERTGCEELEATSEVVKRCVAPGGLCCAVWRIAAAHHVTTQLADCRRARGRGRRRPGLARRQRGKRRLRRSMQRGQGSPCSLSLIARRASTPNLRRQYFIAARQAHTVCSDTAKRSEQKRSDSGFSAGMRAQRLTATKLRGCVGAQRHEGDEVWVCVEGSG
jgi:hypothetical protein